MECVRGDTARQWESQGDEARKGGCAAHALAFCGAAPWREHGPESPGTCYGPQQVGSGAWAHHLA